MPCHALELLRRLRILPEFLADFFRKINFVLSVPDSNWSSLPTSMAISIFKKIEKIDDLIFKTFLCAFV